VSIPQQLRAQVDQFVENYPGFQQRSKEVSRKIQEAIFAQGEEGREVADVLHGKQVGHPLHPILTDITIGSWTLGVLFDFLGLLTRSRTSQKAANRLIALGTISAVPTALAGITDFSGIKQNAAGHAAAHGIINSVALFFFWRSVRVRAKGNQLSGFYFAVLGLGLMTFASWLGGDLVYHRRVGVNHTPEKKIADDWTPTLPAGELVSGTLHRVDVEGYPVLLYKHNRKISAISAVCSHAGGPLEEGTLQDGCVECPWHKSVFDLQDGHVVHGPATYEQPHFETRVREGQIEIRRWRLGMDESPIESEGSSSQNNQQAADENA